MKTRKKVQVWVHSLSMTEGRLVLLLRTIPDRGDFWQPVTGGVHQDEEPKRAALREAEEETSLGFLKPPVPIGYEFEFDGRWGHAHETAFELEAPPGASQLEVKLDPKEHHAFRWVSPTAALGMLQFDTNREALLRLIRRWSLGPN